MRFIGCKTLLLDNIKAVVDEKAPEAKTFCDIFQEPRPLPDILNSGMRFIPMIYCIFPMSSNAAP